MLLRRRIIIKDPLERRPTNTRRPSLRGDKLGPGRGKADNSTKER